MSTRPPLLRASVASAFFVALAVGCNADEQMKSGDPMPTLPANSTAAGTEAPAAPMAGTGGQAAMQEPVAMPPRVQNTVGAAAPVVMPQPTSMLDANAILRGGCATSTVESTLIPTNMLFVVDRTGTMACNPPPTTESSSCEQTPERVDPNLPSKWEITTDALIQAMKSLPETATVGISYFSNDDACGVQSNPSVPLAANTQAQHAAMEASLGSVTPGGGTPLVGATILAYRHMHELALAGSIRGNEFVVLITDGEQSEQCSYEPRCADAQTCYDVLLDQEVPKAAGPGVGIRTFVIGAPGSEPARTVLSTIAYRGGTGAEGCDPAVGNCHFDMTTQTDFGQALSDALGAIVGEAISCELDIPVPRDGAAVDLNRLNVIHSGVNGDVAVVPQDTRAPCEAGANGWQYNEDQTKIRLCGVICDTVRSDEGGRVDVVLGCPIQRPD